MNKNCFILDSTLVPTSTITRDCVFKVLWNEFSPNKLLPLFTSEQWEDLRSRLSIDFPDPNRGLEIIRALRKKIETYDEDLHLPRFLITDNSRSQIIKDFPDLVIYTTQEFLDRNSLVVKLEKIVDFVDPNQASEVEYPVLSVIGNSHSESSQKSDQTEESLEEEYLEIVDAQDTEEELPDEECLEIVDVQKIEISSEINLRENEVDNSQKTNKKLEIFAELLLSIGSIIAIISILILAFENIISASENQEGYDVSLTTYNFENTSPISLNKYLNYSNNDTDNLDIEVHTKESKSTVGTLAEPDEFSFSSLKNQEGDDEHDEPPNNGGNGEPPNNSDGNNYDESRLGNQVIVEVQPGDEPPPLFGGSSPNNGGGQPRSGGGKPPTDGNPDIESGLDGQAVFDVEPGDVVTISGFGDVGRGSQPSQEIIDEIDTIRFSGDGLTASNLQLFQNGDDLEISFIGDTTGTKVVLLDFDLEHLDNLHRDTGANINRGNILFSNESEFEDSFDVFNNDALDTEELDEDSSAYHKIWKRDSVTFLNDSDNNVQGFKGSDDVIHDLGGNDVLISLSVDDTLRGDDGDDFLKGGRDNDTYRGGSGADTFVLGKDEGTDTITDFEVGTDQIVLSSGLSTNDVQLLESGNDTHVLMKRNSEVSRWTKLSTSADAIHVAFKGMVHCRSQPES